MARGTHYETLGLRATATDAEVKAAYRKIVLRHHPDRSSAPESTRLFMEATEAYEVLGDGPARRRYDEGLRAEAARAAERQAEERKSKEADARVRAARAASTAPRAEARPKEAPKPAVSLPTQLARLSMLFSRGLYAEAEKLADEIVVLDPRQPLPYAIRGDLARQRGKMDEAARQYSLAIQMDPRNPTYLRRYEEVLERSQATMTAGGTKIDPEDRKGLSLLVLGAVVVLCGAFLGLSPEKPLPTLGGGTVGLIAMLFLGGAAAGACLSAGGLLDRLDAYAAGRLGPTVALGLVALVSFPAAAVLYAVLGLLQRAFNLTTTRLILGVAAVVGTFALAAFAGPAHVPFAGTLLWGGNLAYLGALCGWAVADSLRH